SRMRDDPTLREAYLHTTYWVEARPSPIALRIGEHSRALDHVLARRATRCWAFVTAWNPRSERVASWCNARKQAQLRRALADNGYDWLPAVGQGDDTGWAPEPSMLVLGMSARDAMRVARRFQQNAVLVGRLCRRATLIWTLERDLSFAGLIS